MQNVIVLGGSYAGARAAQLLAQGLKNKFRVIMIDRNSHANHLYVLPRFSVLPGHEHKAFIPYTRIFNPPSTDTSDLPHAQNAVLHTKVTIFSQHDVTIDRTFPELGFHSPVIPYKHAVYALGSHLSAPINMWSSKEAAVSSSNPEVPFEEHDKGYSGTKKEATAWLKRYQDLVRAADSILCVGGGPLGIQFATDIKTFDPEKHVTLLHSRSRLLPRFDYDLHCEVLKTIEDLQIDLILGERLDLSTTRPEAAKFNKRGQRVVRTEKGREIAADLLLLCTGQIPNTDLLAEMSPQSVDPKTKLAYVLPTMQLGIIPPHPSGRDSSDNHVKEALPSEFELKQLHLRDEASLVPNDQSKKEVQTGKDDVKELQQLPDTPFPHIFAIGDCADAFGAIKSGRAAYFQADVAARNIIRLAQRDAEAEAKNEAVSCASESEVSVSTKAFRPEALELESYTPDPPMIKVSLGIGQASAYQFNGMVGRKDTPESDDLDAPRIWNLFGFQNVKPEEMYD